MPVVSESRVTETPPATSTWAWARAWDSGTTARTNAAAKERSTDLVMENHTWEEGKSGAGGLGPVQRAESLVGATCNAALTRVGTPGTNRSSRDSPRAVGYPMRWPCADPRSIRVHRPPPALPHHCAGPRSRRPHRAGAGGRAVGSLRQHPSGHHFRLPLGR